jgi:hypothetical protein
MVRACAALMMFVAGCSANPATVPVSIEDAGPEDSGFVDDSGLEPVPPLDASICNCNGGSGTCAPPNLSCPVDNACCYFVCEQIGENLPTCVGKPVDGGP